MSDPTLIDPIAQAIRNEWPIHARKFASLGLIPPVRDGGHTATLIDLAVHMTRARLADDPAMVERVARVLWPRMWAITPTQKWTDIPNEMRAPARVAARAVLAEIAGDSDE